MYISRIERLITIGDEVLFKARVSCDGMLSRKVFSESSHHIETYINVVVEVIEFCISVAFEFCLDEEFIEYWLSDIMFESQHATIFV